jgi:cytochrome c553
MLRWTLVMATLLIGFSPGLSHVQDEQQATSTPEIMQEKLDRAQILLEAVVLRDYPTVIEQAERLRYLSEFQSWFVLPTPEYAQHSEEFRAAAKAAVEAGTDENAEGVSASYFAMVDECVQCHEYLSRVRAESKR